MSDTCAEESRMSHNIQLINGQWTAGLGHEIFSKNPAKNQVIWQGNTASPAQVDEAVLGLICQLKSVLPLPLNLLNY